MEETSNIRKLHVGQYELVSAQRYRSRRQVYGAMGIIRAVAFEHEVCPKNFEKPEH